MSSKLRMSGMISGIDTESIISALVSSRQAKVDTTKGEQTKLGWKQDIWKDLNKDLKSLHSTVANMRFSTAYSKKTTNVSNSNKASVITSDSATNSVQSLKIDSLAKTAYLTGGTVNSADGKATALTKMSELGFSGNGSFKVEGTDVTIDIDENTTISNVLSKLQKAGLNATFDANNQRLFVSAKKSGADSNFALTALDSDGADALAKLGLQSKSYYESATTYTDADVEATVNSRLSSKLDAYAAAKKDEADIQTKLDELNTKYGVASGDDIDERIDAAKENVKNLKEQLEQLSRDDYESDEAYESAKTALKENIKSAETEADELGKIATYRTDLAAKQSTIAELEANFVNIVDNGDGTYGADASAALISQVESDYADRAADATSKISKSGTQYATFIEGTNAEITLNGAKFTSNSNVFEVNGLTITAMATTAADEEITLTTENDTKGIYDMVKNFLKSYNSIINKLAKLYNADSAKDYNPLTDEEKEAMSENEVEKYEEKIKDSLLRRDSNVNSIINGLTGIMMEGVTVGKQTMHLSDFGINTLSYFDAAENEKYAYHIDGDADDDATSGNEDKLASMIKTDPDGLVKFFSKLSQNLYKKMSALSTSVNGYRSFGSFYDDKKMTTDYSDYKTKISDMEQKVNDYEDKLYKQYSAMETALAKLQSNSSAVTGMLGSN